VLQKNKLPLILSSIIILLPCLIGILKHRRKKKQRRRHLLDPSPCYLSYIYERKIVLEHPEQSDNLT
jgi:uncharacterized membrane protein YkgB